MAKGPNWAAIKAEYLKGGTSYRKLAEKHGVSFNTLKDRAKAESWAEQAQQVHHAVTTELPAVVAEVVLSEAADWVAETLSIARTLRQKMKNSIEGEQVRIVSTPLGPKVMSLPVLNTAQDIKALASALADIDKTARQALGLDAKKEEGGDQNDVPSITLQPPEGRTL